ncbi:MAG: type IV pilus assembly protein PilM [Methylococcales bacterium]|nr:type IV pilus assembly protein PilM [Methylococcales bacterium]
MIQALSTALSWLQPKPQTVLSIDISAVSIKILALQKQRNLYHVKDYTKLSFCSETNPELASITPTFISDALTKALQKIPGTYKKASICVNSSTIISKQLLLDASIPRNEFEENVLLVANQYIPYGLEDIYYDYKVLGENPFNSKMLDVLFIASRRENVSTKIDILTQAGLITHIVDIDSYALINACNLLPEYIKRSLDQQTISVVDIGAVNYTFIIVRNNQVIYTHVQDFGCNQLILALQTEYLCTYEVAQKIIYGIDLAINDPNIVLTRFINSLIKQIQLTQEDFIAANHNTKIDCIFLCGGGAILPNLIESLEKSINVPTFKTNPFLSMTIAEHIDKKTLHEIAPTLMVCSGLAIRSFI